MNAKWRVLIPILGMVGLLSGCAGPMPKPDAQEAWVGLREEPDAVLLAGKLDGKRLDDGRYFEVPPGKHRLDMTLIVDGVGDNDEQTCRASVNFSQFKAGAHYKLVESSLGQDYSIKLEDNAGQQLGHKASITCLPG